MKRRHCGFTVGMALALGSSILVLHAQEKPSREKHDGSVSQEAKSTFGSICAGCHGLDGRGGERGPDVVSRSEVLRKTDAELFAVLKEGRPNKGMPAFAAYGDKQLSALIGYLRELQGSGKQAVTGGDEGRGKELFFGRAKCSDCHMVSGQGGFYGQDLTGYAARRTAEEVRAAIIAPGKGRDPRTGLLRVKLADSTLLTGMPRNEDNFSLQLQTDDGKFHLLDKAQIVSLERTGSSAMPSDYGRRLTEKELTDLVSFLSRSASAENTQKAAQPSEDGDDE